MATVDLSTALATSAGVAGRGIRAATWDRLRAGVRATAEEEAERRSSLRQELLVSGGKGRPETRDAYSDVSSSATLVTRRLATLSAFSASSFRDSRSFLTGEPSALERELK